MVILVHRAGFVGLRGFVQGDLGLLLNVPRRILNGEIPYRDFYAGNYSPGSYYFHAFLFWLWGTKASVLSLAQGLSCVVSLLLIFFLSKRVCSQAGTFIITALSLILWLPIANIPFPAVYGTTLGLAIVGLLVKWRDSPSHRYLVTISALLGVVLASKISLGIFLILMVLWVVLIGNHATQWLRWLALAMVVASGVLIRERFYVATVLMFMVPLFLLAIYSGGLFQSMPKKMDLKFWGALILPGLIVTLLWSIPFLFILGPEQFYFHFWKFPSLQPRVLYYPPAGWGGSYPHLQSMGFLPISRLKDLHKIWFYLPLVMSAVGLFRLLRNDLDARAHQAMEIFFAFNALLQLQMFPTVDLLHFQWSAAGSLLLLGEICFSKERPMRQAIVWLLLIGLSCSGLLAGRYFAAKKLHGGYVQTQLSNFSYFYPAPHVQSLHEIKAYLEEHLGPKDEFWNPPGNLLNFILERPLVLPSDYFGPNYMTQDQRNQWLAALQKSAPKWVVVTQFEERDFGLSALQRNFPEIYDWLKVQYAPPTPVGEFLVFKVRPNL